MRRGYSVCDQRSGGPTFTRQRCQISHSRDPRRLHSAYTHSVDMPHPAVLGGAIVASIATVVAVEVAILRPLREKHHGDVGLLLADAGHKWDEFRASWREAAEQVYREGAKFCGSPGHEHSDGWQEHRGEGRRSSTSSHGSDQVEMQSRPRSPTLSYHSNDSKSKRDFVHGASTQVKASQTGSAMISRRRSGQTFPPADQEVFHEMPSQRDTPTAYDTPLVDLGVAPVSSSTLSGTEWSHIDNHPPSEVGARRSHARDTGDYEAQSVSPLDHNSSVHEDVAAWLRSSSSLQSVTDRRALSPPGRQRAEGSDVTDDWECLTPESD